MKRNRFIYFMLIMFTTTLCISSRKYVTVLPQYISDYASDILWALMVYFGFGFFMYKKSIKNIVLSSFIFSCLIEISQLYKSDWINNIRNTTIGSLILGNGFLESDLICYAIGIFIGTLLENIYLKIKK